MTAVAAATIGRCKCQWILLARAHDKGHARKHASASALAGEARERELHPLQPLHPVRVSLLISGPEECQDRRVAVGGRGTLVGAALGAVVVNYAKTFFTSGALAPYWLFMLGALFILVTLLLPKGIVGTFNSWWEPLKARRLTTNAESADAEDGVSEPHMAE